jgi:hypothetical protein
LLCHIHLADSDGFSFDGIQVLQEPGSLAIVNRRLGSENRGKDYLAFAAQSR